MCNLTTAIFHNNEWDPTKLFGQNQHLVPPPRQLDDSIPFGERRELIVDIDVNPRGMNIIYIENLISLTVIIEGTDNLDQCNQAPLLMFDTCSHPLNPNKLIPRETMEAWSKLQLEALLEEKKVILGWLINFCQLLIIFPVNKFKAWTTVIEIMISDCSSTAKVLETNIGRLEHLRLAIPIIHHFMIWLWDLHSIAKQQRSVKINGEHLKDVHLMLDFLKNANAGISLNNIAFRRPTHIFWSDSCPAGLGAYSQKILFGDGTFQRISNSEHQTTFWNISQQ
jgi:hypothetical protein